MTTKPLRITFCIAAIVVLTPLLSGLADADPGKGRGHGGGGGGGGPPHTGGGHGGPPHAGGGGGGSHGGPRLSMPHGGPRHAIQAMPRGPAMRGVHGPRIHAGPRVSSRAYVARSARPVFDRAAAARSARALNRAALDRRAMNRNMNRDVARGRDLNRNLSRDIARGAAPSNRAAAREALRSAPVHARADARNANAFALRAFSGRDALAATGRVFRDPALFSRHRFDPAFFARVRFAGAFWPGPFFWPYAYYDEAFWLWPSAYDEAFWTYGYDDMLLGIYRPYAFSDYDDFVDAIGPVRRARGQAQAPAPRSFAELCGQAAPGLTDWPVDQIAAAIEPTQQQRALIDELVQASDKAAETLRAACPRGVAVTPISRLDAMQQQFGALQQAVRLVRPRLEGFYASLSDDQKERFNALAPKSTPDRRARGAAAPQADRLARACAGREAGPAEWSIERIEDTVRPGERQRAALGELRAASAEAGRVVAAACPSELPLTPTGRLGVMEGRIDAMLQAIATLRPALAKFYATLNDEQKARFNRTLLTGDRRTG